MSIMLRRSGAPDGPSAALCAPCPRRGASSGEGLGNAFLSNISAVDGIFHVCRAFEDADVVHVEDRVDPVEDLEIIHKCAACSPAVLRRCAAGTSNPPSLQEDMASFMVSHDTCPCEPEDPQVLA